jgi:hypothetical protein
MSSELEKLAFSNDSSVEELSTPTASEKMLESGGNSSNKSYKKLMKKVQNDPRLQELINQFKNQPLEAIAHDAIDPKQKLRMKLEKSRLRRSGPLVQEAHEKKQKQKREAQQKKEKTPEEKNAEIQNKVTSTVSQSIDDVTRKTREKLRKLQKKYGKISFERYSEALVNLSAEIIINKDSYQHEKNIVDLYLKQNITHNEIQIDDLEADLDDLNNLDDLEADLVDLDNLGDLEDTHDLKETEI